MKKTAVLILIALFVCVPILAQAQASGSKKASPSFIKRVEQFFNRSSRDSESDQDIPADESNPPDGDVPIDPGDDDNDDPMRVSEMIVGISIQSVTASNRPRNGCRAFGRQDSNERLIRIDVSPEEIRDVDASILCQMLLTALSTGRSVNVGGMPISDEPFPPDLEGIDANYIRLPGSSMSDAIPVEEPNPSEEPESLRPANTEPQQMKPRR